jgi:UDP-4-amino-4,6-dideoxy-N-acetyl-beta-L-altrosamine transaminase
MSFLPYARQSVTEADIEAVTRVLRGDWLTTGPAGPAFEAALAETVGAGYAVACSSGTAALHLAYLGAGLGPGDAVIVPSITFLASANAARMTGAEAIFADVDPATGLLTAATATEAIARAERAGLEVKAILPVHLAGQCADLTPLSVLAKQHGAVVIEDACHALGTRTMGGCVGDGAHSLMTVFSMHAVKTIAAGEGGAVTTNDPGLKARLDRLRNHGMDRDFADDEAPWRYDMHEVGFNYRLSDLQAALATSQLGRLDALIEHRLQLVQRYDSWFGADEASIHPLGRVATGRVAWHLYPLLVDFERAGISRGSLMNALRERGIGTQVHYMPVHRQPYYRDRVGAAALPGAESYYARTLSLPLHCAMSPDDADRVAEIVLSILAGRARPAFGKKIAA